MPLLSSLPHPAGIPGILLLSILKIKILNGLQYLVQSTLYPHMRWVHLKLWKLLNSGIDSVLITSIDGLRNKYVILWLIGFNYSMSDMRFENL